MEKFLRITTNAGTQYVSGPYTRLARVGAYVRRVMAGAEPLAVWSPISNVHPVTGAPATLRTRRFINGREVECIEQVAWTPTALSVASQPDLSNPSAPEWTPVVHVGSGSAGSFTVKTDALAERLGIPVGTRLPRVRNSISGGPSVVWLNADGTRYFVPSTNELYEDGVLVRPEGALDEDDEAAMVPVGSSDFDDDDSDDDSDDDDSL